MTHKPIVPRLQISHGLQLHTVLITIMIFLIYVSLTKADSLPNAVKHPVKRAAICCCTLNQQTCNAGCVQTCTFPHANSSCQQGVCAIRRCDQGYGNCDDVTSNGCETSLINNINTCGSCSISCSFPNAQPACNGTKCRIATCNPGYRNCDGNVTNGCEINTDTNVLHCGSCLKACNIPNANPKCVAGACLIDTCQSGYMDCDGKLPNGCETAITTLTNCGNCRTPCSLPHATATCSNGTCAIVQCNGGFTNDDGNDSNGCEGCNLILASMVSYPSSAGCPWITTADFNNDGRLDIAFTDGNFLAVRLGNGNGSFAAEVSFPAGNGPIGMASADLNHDNKQDIIVVNNLNNNIGIFLGHGNGSFTSQTILTTNGNSPVGAAVGDINSDTHPDVVVTNQYSNTVTVFLGLGDGNFTGQNTFSVGASPFSILLNDFNQDGKLDIVTANTDSNNLALLLGYGNGSFAGYLAIPIGNCPYGVTSGYINNDTNLDLVAGNFCDDTISILFGFGNGGFSAPIIISTGSNTGPHSVAITDLNKDTHADIIVANYNGNSISIILGFGNSTFAAPSTLLAGTQVYTVVAGDFNGDTRSDIAVANLASKNVGIYLNDCLCC